MSKHYGSNAYFQLLPNNPLVGNKTFEGPNREKNCAAEFSRTQRILQRMAAPAEPTEALLAPGTKIMPPCTPALLQPMKITMVAYDITLEKAIINKQLSSTELQDVVFRVTDMLMSMSHRTMLMMDVHVANVLLKYQRGKLVDVVIGDPGFMHEFDNNVLPPHCRSCPFDPQYDLAFFSYSLLGMCKLHGVPFPVTPVSQRELSHYDQYIHAPHEWKMAVGCYAYYPKQLTAFQKYHHGTSG